MDVKARAVLFLINRRNLCPGPIPCDHSKIISTTQTVANQNPEMLIKLLLVGIATIINAIAKTWFVYIKTFRKFLNKTYFLLAGP
jgi:hypothetical protein